jgi:hypothetical protein
MRVLSASGWNVNQRPACWEKVGRLSRLDGMRRVFAAVSAAECSASDKSNDGSCTAVAARVPRDFLEHGRGGQLPAPCSLAVQRPTPRGVNFRSYFVVLGSRWHARIRVCSISCLPCVPFGKNGVPEKTLCRHRLDAATVPRPFILPCIFCSDRVNHGVPESLRRLPECCGFIARGDLRTESFAEI